MVVENIYIARHGYRSNWLPNPPEPVTGIDSDHLLAPHGLEQAEELAKFVTESLEERPQLIFSSPFYRCIQTATPISRILDLDIIVENGIGEWYKPTRSVIPEPATLDLLNKFFENLNQHWESTITASSKGETDIDILNRCKTFWAKFLPKLNEKFPKVKNIILVSHAATKIALGMSLLGYDSVKEPVVAEDGSLVYLRAASCSLDHFALKDNKWVMKFTGRTDFLSKGEEMNWDFQNGVEAGSDEDIAKRKAAAAGADSSEKPRQTSNDDGKDANLESVYVLVDVPNVDIRNKILEAPHKKSSSAFQGSHSATIQKPRYTRSSYQQVKHDSNNSLLAATRAIVPTNFVPTSQLQVTGLETENPIFRVDGAFYEGEWQKLLGTELIFDENGQVVAALEDHIELKHGELRLKNENTVIDNSKDGFLSKIMKIAEQRESGELSKADEGELLQEDEDMSEWSEK